MTDIHVFESKEALFKQAADLILQLSELFISKTGKFSIALSGGSTPEKLYELLATEPYSKKINWDKTFVFWSDERCVPFDDKDNNGRMAFNSLLGKVNIPKENIFLVPVSLEPIPAAVAYEQSIRNYFGDDIPKFDLILLGLGEDGHTASLFPGTSILKERKAWVKEVFVEQKNSYRISFTASLINHAHNILFLVTGKEKAIIADAVINKNSEHYPARLVKPLRGRLHWYLDKDAASLLKN